MDFDSAKTLQELENDDWGDPRHTTNMVRRCHELRRLPIREMNAEDCRLLLGQNIGTRFVIFRALEILSQDPLAGGVMLPCSLLRNVLDLDPDFWKEFPSLWWQVKEIIFEIERIHEDIKTKVLPLIQDFERLELG